MIELIEKTLMVGVGALSLSQKKGEELLKELKERLNVSEEEGKTLLNRLQTYAEENQKRLADMAQEEVKKAYERAGLVSKEDFVKLQKKVAQLEKQLKASGKKTTAA